MLFVKLGKTSFRTVLCLFVVVVDFKSLFLMDARKLCQNSLVA